MYNYFKASTRLDLCPGFTYLELLASDRDNIVRIHNEYRQSVAVGMEGRGNPGPQPKAANMRQMKWDKELAYFARIWAAQCSRNHDFCRDSGKIHRIFLCDKPN